nr:hypothetical protein [Tanacetum cinerariifolium]
MVVHIPLAMSSGLSASMAEVAAMYESAFRKRFRSSYESLPSLSPPDLPLRKSYRGTSELVEDSDKDDDEEDEEIKESLDSDSVSEDLKDEGPTVKDENPTAGDEGLAAGVEGPGTNDERHGMDDKSHGLDDEGHSVESDRLGLEEEEEEAVYEDPEDGMVYIDVPAYPPSAPPMLTPSSPEWTSDSLPISPSPSVVPSPVLSPIIPLSRDAGGLIRNHSVRLEELSPALFERYDRDIGELFTRSGEVRDEIFCQIYRFRSLEHEHERTAITFGALKRHVLALEAWTGRVDTRMIDMSWVGYDDYRLVHDMLLQQTALQRELQQMRGRVNALEQEIDRRER